MKRMNPVTNAPFKYGDVREDGYKFEKYGKILKKDGYFVEQWRSPESEKTKKEAEKHYMTTKEGRIMNNLSVIRVRSKAKNIPYNLSLPYVRSIATDNCPVFGFPLEWNRQSSGKPSGPKYNSPSLDRIDPKKGYVKGNVVWISMKANSIKNDATIEELEKVTQWLKTAQQATF